jgi:hypothetical protein
MRKTVLSRHRLPNKYRYSIAALWLTPIFLLTLTILIGKGLTPALLDPRYLLPLAVLTIPAVYIWQEGVDVLPNGIRTRIHIPRYHDYSALDSWHFDQRRQRCILIVWDKGTRKVLECHAGHLSDLPLLLDSLRRHVPSRRDLL